MRIGSGLFTSGQHATQRDSQTNHALAGYRRRGYSPKTCSLYKAGPTSKVPSRKGMTWVEEDWIDEDAAAHRGEDE